MKVKILNRLGALREWECDDAHIDGNWLILYRNDEDDENEQTAIAMFCNPASVIIEDVE